MFSLATLVALVTTQAVAYDADTAAGLPWADDAADAHCARAPNGSSPRGNAAPARGQGASHARQTTEDGRGRGAVHTEHGTMGRVVTEEGTRVRRSGPEGGVGRVTTENGSRGRMTHEGGTRAVVSHEGGTRAVVSHEGGTRAVVSHDAGRRGVVNAPAGSKSRGRHGAVVVHTPARTPAPRVTGPVHTPVRVGGPVVAPVHTPVRVGGPVVATRPVVVYGSPRPVVVHPAPRPVVVYGQPRTVVVHEGPPAPVVVHEREPAPRAPRLDRAQSIAVGAHLGSLVGGYVGGSGYGDLGFGIDARYRPSAGFGLDLGLAQHRDAYSPLSERDQTAIAASAELFAFSDSMVQPYLLGGLTWMGRDVHDEGVIVDGAIATVDAHSALWGPHGGLGVEFAFGRTVALDLEARLMGAVNRLPTDPQSPYLATTSAGLKFHF